MSGPATPAKIKKTLKAQKKDHAVCVPRAVMQLYVPSLSVFKPLVGSNQAFMFFSEAHSPFFLCVPCVCVDVYVE